MSDRLTKTSKPSVHLPVVPPKELEKIVVGPIRGDRYFEMTKSNFEVLGCEVPDPYLIVVPACMSLAPGLQVKQYANLTPNLSPDEFTEYTNDKLGDFSPSEYSKRVREKLEVSKPEPDTEKTVDKDTVAKPNELQFQLLPPEWEAVLAFIAAKGAMKYAPRDWEKNPGKYMDRIDSCRRHLNRWLSGEDFDVGKGGTNAHNLGNAAYNLLMVLTWQMRGVGDDNRSEVARGFIEGMISDLRESKV